MTRSLLALAFAAALPMSAQAADVSYTFVEADYVRSNPRHTESVDPEGFGLKGSFLFAEKFYGFGSYINGSDTVSGFDVDASRTQLGVGHRYVINDKIDFNTELSAIRQTVDVDGIGDASANGYRLSGGWNGLLNANWEGYIKGNYTDGDDFGGDFSATIGTYIKAGKNWGLTGEGEFGGDLQVLMVGVRASF